MNGLWITALLLVGISQLFLNRDIVRPSFERGRESGLRLWLIFGMVGGIAQAGLDL